MCCQNIGDRLSSLASMFKFASEGDFKHFVTDGGDWHQTKLIPQHFLPQGIRTANIQYVFLSNLLFQSRAY